MQQLRRKQMMLESDELRLARLLKQAADEPTRLRLKRERRGRVRQERFEIEAAP